MKANLIRIGNSRGLRILKTLIEACGFGEKVELHVQHNCLVLSPGRKPRERWDEQFRAAELSCDGHMLDIDVPRFDAFEWDW